MGPVLASSNAHRLIKELAANATSAVNVKIVNRIVCLCINNSLI